MNKKLLTLSVLSALIVGCNSNSNNSNTPDTITPEPTNPNPDLETTYQTNVKVVAANMWQSVYRNFPTNDRSSYEIALEELKYANADILLLQEASGINARLAEDLNMYLWQGEHDKSSIGILSKYPIKDVMKSFSNADRGNVIGAVLDINGRDTVVWSAHLDYTHYITYDARGGNGTTWQAREGCIPVQDPQELDALNDESNRPAQARHIVETTQPYLDKNAVIIFGGDFNEPSGLDWTEDSANQFDRKGTVYDFSTHKIVRQAGYTDSFRELYPDPVSNPGATWPFHAEDSWTGGQSYINECGRKLDDRDRIDFVYYNANAENIKLTDVSIIGPKVNTYFPGPHGEDDTYNWADPHSGTKVDMQGEPQYGEREFVSDHLWYSASFIIETPLDTPQTKAVHWEPQFENVDIIDDGDDLLVSFDLTNLDLWEDDRSYQINVMGNYTSARADEIWQVEPLVNKPTSRMQIRISQETLQKLSTTTDYSTTIQLRLRSSTKINGWQKDYAVFTIPKSEIEKYIAI